MAGVLSQQSTAILATFADTITVEIYENQSKHRKKGWIPWKKSSFVLKPSLSPCKSLEEIIIPNDSGWSWNSNWKIVRSSECTNDEGWEYASRFARFKDRKRTIRYEPGRRKSRRRLWIRVMKKEIRSFNNMNLPKLIVKIRRSLANIRMARTEIENMILSANPASSSSSSSANASAISISSSNLQMTSSLIDLLESILLLMDEFSLIIDVLQKRNRIDQDQHLLTADDIMKSFLIASPNNPSAVETTPANEIEQLLSISTLLINLADDIQREKVRTRQSFLSLLFFFLFIYFFFYSSP